MKNRQTYFVGVRLRRSSIYFSIWCPRARLKAAIASSGCRPSISIKYLNDHFNKKIFECNSRVLPNNKISTSINSMCTMNTNKFVYEKKNKKIFENLSIVYLPLSWLSRKNDWTARKNFWQHFSGTSWCPGTRILQYSISWSVTSYDELR
jgi:hypothetical protein